MQRLVSTTVRRAGQRTLFPALRFASQGQTTQGQNQNQKSGSQQGWQDLKPSSSKDIVDRILHDHQLIEAHFRALRDRTSNRDQVLSSFADLLIAHSEAEEQVVYPRVRQAAESAGEPKREKKESAETEHTAALVNLLALMESNSGPNDHATWEKKLHMLVAGVFKHVEEEECTMLNVARLDMSEQQRAEIGEAFAKIRQQQLSQNCGNVNNVRKLVDERANILLKMKEKVMAAV